MSILQPGQVLTGQDGHQWRIEKLLGSGMTAEVYQAVSVDEQRPPVAMKYLRPGMVADVRRLFFAEAENLQRVYQAWNSAKEDEGTLGQLTRFFPFPAPRLQGVSEEPPFILMDLIQEDSLDAFLQRRWEETEQGERESVVVGLGVHLGTLLWVLHEKARRCYSDMKIENFWWIGEDSKPALLLTDWNVLNEVEEEWVHRDLFLATLMFYTWLTGDVLPRQRLQVTVPLGTVASFRKLSRGTQQFLRRALSPALEMRYATAREWTLALLEIWQWWRMGDELLLAELAKRFDEIQRVDAKIREQESQGALPRELVLEQAEAYRVFGSMLDVATWRDLETPEEYDDAFTYYSEHLLPRGIGLRALQGLSFDLALEQFERGASLFPSEALAYRHWWTLADGARRMPMERFRVIREGAVEGVQKANAQQWQEAKVLLDEAAAAVAGMEVEQWRVFLQRVAEGDETPNERWRENGIILLDMEAWVAVWYREAEEALQRGDYERAQTLAREAQRLIGFLPGDEKHVWYVQHSDIAAIEDKAARRKQAVAKENEIWRTWQEALRQKRWEKALDALRNAWDWLPEEQREQVSARWEETARQMWEEGAAEALRQLVNRWAVLASNEETKTKHMVWQNLSSALSLLSLLAETRANQAEVTQASEGWWHALFEHARALNWGVGLVALEASAWERMLLEQGRWSQWDRLMRLWLTVTWVPWQNYLRKRHDEVQQYLVNYVESALRRLESLTMILAPEVDMPLFAMEVHEQAEDLAHRIAQVKGWLSIGALEERLAKVQQRVKRWLLEYQRHQSHTTQKRETAWEQLDVLLKGGMAFPMDYYWAVMVSHLSTLVALGERDIPEERRNVQAYYQAFVKQDTLTGNGASPVEHMWRYFLSQWVNRTHAHEWFAYLELLKAEGKWDEIYLWTRQLLGYLSKESASSVQSIRSRLEEWQNQALEVLAFLAKFASLPAQAEQSVVAE